MFTFTSDRGDPGENLYHSVLQRVAACCSVLQRVAVCCSVLQYVAEGCWQRVFTVAGRYDSGEDLYMGWLRLVRSLKL